MLQLKTQILQVAYFFFFLLVLLVGGLKETKTQSVWLKHTKVWLKETSFPFQHVSFPLWFLFVLFEGDLEVVKKFIGC